MKANNNELTKNLSRKGKWYNPNSYTPTDSAAAFIIIVLLFLILSFFLPNAVSYLYKNGIVKDYYFLLLVSGIITQSLIFSVAFLFSKIRHVSLFSGGGYKYSFNIVDILFAVILIMGIALLLSGTHFKFADDVYRTVYGLSFDEYNAQVTLPEIKNPLWAFLYIYVLVPLAPAICEELLFRGVIMRGFEKYGGVVCALLSASMFALMHGNFAQLILQFSGGLAIAAVTLITKNFLIGAAMHFANNMFTTFVSVQGAVFEDFAVNASYLIDAMTIIIGIVFIAIGVLFYSKIAIRNYKLSIQGKRIQSLDNKHYAIISTKDRLNSDYEKVDSSAIDYTELSSNDDAMIFADKRFRKVNTFRCTPLEFVLICVGLVLAVTAIFLDL